MKLTELPDEHDCDDFEMAGLAAIKVLRSRADELESRDRPRALMLRRKAALIDEGHGADSVEVGIAFVSLALGRAAERKLIAEDQ